MFKKPAYRRSSQTASHPKHAAATTSVTGLTSSLISVTARQHATKALSDPKLARRVDALLKKMTLEEKAGQLAQYSAGRPTGPGTQRDDYELMIARGEVGAFLGVIDAAKANRFQRIAVEKSRLGIPLLFGFDIIHGDRTTFPIPLAMASSFDPELIAATARLAAIESRADGINWVFSPMVDIARDGRWGRVVEGAGEEPLLGMAMAAAAVRGYQQDDLAKPDSVAACVKHLAAYGAPIAGREYNAVELSEITLRQAYLPPYQAAVDAGVATAMSAFNTLNGIPCTGHRGILTDILRKEWGFEGFVVSDWGSVGELRAHGVALDGNAASLKGLTAGTDMDMEASLYGTLLPQLVRSGQLPLKVLDEAVRRVLRIKFALGLFERPYVAQETTPVPTPQGRALALHAAESSIVLLKNDGDADHAPVLPLRNQSKIALIGPFADAAHEMIGPWVGGGKAAHVVTLKQAMEERASQSGLSLIYEKGTDLLSDSDAGFEAAVAAAKQSDVVILTLGEHPEFQAGESTSRVHLALPDNQQQLLEAISATGKPIVLVLFNGHPLAISWATRHVPAIIETWYLGIEAGHAIANVLFGDTNPSAKLPIAFPRATGQEPLFLGQLSTGRPLKEQVDPNAPPASRQRRYVTCYVDEWNAPLYPYGHGLSYTSFTYQPITASCKRISLRSLTNGKTIKIRVELRNSGQREGTEVVQLYMCNRGVSVAQPIRRLIGFRRIHLAIGESRVVTFTLGLDDLAFVNANLRRTVEPSIYEFFAGGDSTTANMTQVRVDLD